MTSVNIEFIGPTNIYFGLGVEILTALVLGGVIGYDREKKMKSAGIKTNMLICLGATIYTAISMINLQQYSSVADPNRLTAQIVSGIGFLGAGAIIQGRGGVKGLTTAATIWVVAAIGVTIGLGYPIVATIFSVTLLSVLKLLGPIYRILEKRRDLLIYHMEILSKGSIKNRVKGMLAEDVDEVYDLHDEILNEKKDRIITYISILAHPRKVDDLIVDLKNIIRVEEVNYYTSHSRPKIREVKEDMSA